MIVKLSNQQLNKLKSATKREDEVVLRLSSNMIDNSDGETNFPHKLLLLTKRQVANLCKPLAKNLSTDIKLSKTQLSPMIQSEGFLGRLLGPLLKTGLQLMKNVIKKCFGCIRINSSSISSRCRNTQKDLRLWNNDNTNNVK